MLAAGILGMSSSTMRLVAESGAGAIVTKSLGLKSRRGYSNPTVVQVEGGLLNAMGLPNPGIKYFTQEIRNMHDIGIPLIVSIYAFTPNEFAAVAKEAAKAGADALELNVSCPHAEKTGAEIGQNPRLVEEATAEVKSRVEKPVFVKLTPNVANIAEVAKAAERAGADAVTAINTIKAMAINVETARPILGNMVGGLSGAAIRPIALRCVYEIYKAVKIPIVGCGGVNTWKDAVEFLEAGASAVQIGTAIAINGLNVFRKITEGISIFLERKRLGSVKEIVGSSHRS